MDSKSLRAFYQVRKVIQTVYASRDNLAQTLTDASTIADHLSWNVSVFLRILWCFSALAVLEIDVSTCPPRAGTLNRPWALSLDI